VSYQVAQAITALVWWVCVIVTYAYAKDRGRNRFGWTVAAMFVPLIAVVLVIVLPSRRSSRELA
jgi:hypothetical protein